jgi:hypothetical protein
VSFGRDCGFDDFLDENDVPWCFTAAARQRRSDGRFGGAGRCMAVSLASHGYTAQGMRRRSPAAA